MRALIATLLILVIFVVGTFMLNRYIDYSCERLIKSVEALGKSIEDNNWNEAKKQLTDFKEEWEDTKKRWQLFLGHDEMDDINIAIARLDVYVKIEDLSQSIGEVGEIRLLVSRIRDKESPKLGNVL